MFCDEHKIQVIAGAGGDGCVSFRREKFVAMGGPNGGDGGKGGNVVFRVNPNLNTLGHLVHQRVFKGQRGGHGLGKNMFGKNGEDLIIEVPPGTMIFNADKTELLKDMSPKVADKDYGNAEYEDFVVAKGGKGGLGNARFVGSTNQAPRFAENGEPGEEKELVLELKLVAEVGIIGLPSAGKSTLISVISNARPKIAAYHFTTLVPNLGVVKMSDFGGSAEESFVVADIPGLIEGASEGKGLGHQFLKHIARTRILVHVLDGTLEEVIENFKTINQELADFDPRLMEKEQIVVINKIDAIRDEDLLKLEAELIKVIKKLKNINLHRSEVFKISAVARKGLKDLMFKIFEKLKKIREEVEFDEVQSSDLDEDKFPVLRPHLKKVKFEIEKIIRKKDYKIFRIQGDRIEQVAIMTDMNNPEGLERMYRFIYKMGIQKAIEREGAKFGDYIKIGQKKIPYRK